MILFIAGIYYIPTKGKPDPKARLVTPNHVSFFDALYFFYAYKPHFVAKKEAANIPLLGDIFRLIQPILVDRSSKTSRDDVSNEIHRRATWSDDSTSWNPIVIFPEGTCTNGSVLIAFKYGAFKPGVAVQPVVIKYPCVNLDVSLVSGISTTMLFLRSLCQFVNYMEVEYLPLYNPTKKEKENVALYSRNVRSKMAKVLNCPITEHTVCKHFFFTLQLVTGLIFFLLV